MRQILGSPPSPRYETSTCINCTEHHQEHYHQDSGKVKHGRFRSKF